MIRALAGETPPERKVEYSVEIKRAVSGHKVKLDNDEYLMYAGIRAPYESEPFCEEAKRANAELVDDEDARLRYDEETRDDKDRLAAYVFVNDIFVNERLVREGWAYVRLTPVTMRYREVLLEAQDEARQARRGIWSLTPESLESSYLADPKYGNFHRPSCEEIPKIDPDRRQEYSTRAEALDAGTAPCSKCQP